MSVAELQNLIVRHVLAIEDQGALAELLSSVEQHGEPSAKLGGGQMLLREPQVEYGADIDAAAAKTEDKIATPDEVLGYRPDGTPVTVANSAAQWGSALDDFIENGGGTDPKEDLQEMIESVRMRANASR